jgi:hypothetical protein
MTAALPDVKGSGFECVWQEPKTAQTFFQTSQNDKLPAARAGALASAADL